jgi:predicted cobalt transporter CbtA
MIPALKYPANPPAVGDPATIYERQGFYITFTIISGFIALGSALLYRKIDGTPYKKFAIVSIIYVGIIAGVYMSMPNNPDEISASIELVQEFRIASGFSMSVFWLVLGILFGSMWDKLKPHETRKITTI